MTENLCKLVFILSTIGSGITVYNTWEGDNGCVEHIMEGLLGFLGTSLLCILIALFSVGCLWVVGQ